MDEVDLDHLECRPHTTRTETGDNPIVAVFGSVNLFLGPKSGGRRRGQSDGFAEQFGKSRLQVLQVSPIGGCFGQSVLKHFRRSPSGLFAPS